MNKQDQSFQVEITEKTKMPKKMSRRTFLGLSSGSIVVVLAGILGIKVYRDSEGDSPQVGSPLEIVQVAPTLDIQGVPILILKAESTDNPFGNYFTELLRTEGVNCFKLANLSEANKEYLSRFDIVILTEGSLSASDVSLFEDYVSNGGNLIAMHPDPALDGLLGVERISGDLSSGYLITDETHPAAKGIVNQSIQFHGPANYFKLAGAEAVAWLSANSEVPKTNPAITLNRHGKGIASLWAFDLARSVAYMRQGNPKLANTPRKEWDGVRAINQFVDWIDLDKIAIPQADEQQRLLVNLLDLLSQAKRPLPRFWYLPANVKGMVVATGDSHINPARFIDQVCSLVEKYGGHYTVYYTPLLVSNLGRALRRVRSWATDHLPFVGEKMKQTFDAPTPAMVENWRGRGHEFTLHPYVENGLEVSWQRYWHEFTGRGFGPLSHTVRTHRILWTGWVETARVQASYGIRMNMDYYHWGPIFQNPQGHWVFGHFTGSALPMKFIDENGEIINNYQQLTQLADDHMLDLFWGGVAKLPVDQAVEESRTLLKRTIEQYPGVIVYQFHVDPYAAGGYSVDRAQSFLEGSLSYAVSEGYSIWNTQTWLRFTDARHDADFEDISWNEANHQLIFRVTPKSATSAEFVLMIPRFHNQLQLQTVIIDGKDVPVDNKTVGGVSYGSAVIQNNAVQIIARYL